MNGLFLTSLFGKLFFKELLEGLLGHYRYWNVVYWVFQTRALFLQSRLLRRCLLPTISSPPASAATHALPTVIMSTGGAWDGLNALVHCLGLLKSIVYYGSIFVYVISRGWLNNWLFSVFNAFAFIHLLTHVQPGGWSWLLRDVLLCFSRFSFAFLRLIRF